VAPSMVVQGGGAAAAGGPSRAASIISDGISSIKLPPDIEAVGSNRASKYHEVKVDEMD